MQNVMNFAAYTPLSLVDFPQRPSAILFTQGCNLRCPFCHNPQLITRHAPHNTPIPWPSILKQLRARQHLVSAVVLSGGEPTLHQGLCDILRELKQLDFHIKLDTNGTRPQVLQYILQYRLVDYVAMDFKTTPIHHTLKQCLNHLQQHNTPFEIRSTCHNSLNEESLQAFAQMIPTQVPWYLQKCNSTTQYQSLERSTQWAMQQLQELRHIHPHTHLRGWH